MASFLFIGVQHGMGQHEDNLDVDDAVESSKASSVVPSPWGTLLTFNSTYGSPFSST